MVVATLCATSTLLLRKSGLSLLGSLNFADEEEVILPDRAFSLALFSFPGAVGSVPLLFAAAQHGVGVRGVPWPACW